MHSDSLAPNLAILLWIVGGWQGETNAIFGFAWFSELRAPNMGIRTPNEGGFGPRECTRADLPIGILIRGGCLADDGRRGSEDPMSFAVLIGGDPSPLALVFEFGPPIVERC